jgi:hypothetical protein
MKVFEARTLGVHSGLCRYFFLSVVVAAAFAAMSAEVAPASASAKQVRAQVRVVDDSNRQLVDAVVYSSSRRVRTSPQALCFGEGTGGDGGFAPTAVRGPNAMGVLADAAAELGVLRPLKVSDYYAFGHTLCGIGGLEASGLSYWAVWIGGTFVETSADNARVRSGQTVVYQLTEAYPSTSVPAPAPREGKRAVVGSPRSFPVIGTAGGDRVLARDGARDLVRCLGGEDIAFVDLRDRVAGDCEEVRRG